MSKIHIKDLPDDKHISLKEMKMVLGGFNPQPEPPPRNRVINNLYDLSNWYRTWTFKAR